VVSLSTPASDEPDRPHIALRLELSVDESLVRLVRLAVSGVASVLDMTQDDIEACRSAADEMCSTLMQLGHRPGTVSIQIVVEDGALVVTGQAERDAARELEPGRADLAELIVDASADEHEFVTDPPVASFRFLKRGVAARGRR
jgi:anti-sigma regulatory factor (Ser/Thr protein kinase)